MFFTLRTWRTRGAKACIKLMVQIYGTITDRVPFFLRTKSEFVELFSMFPICVVCGVSLGIHRGVVMKTMFQ